MDKLTIFISTPMHNKTEEEIERRFFILTETVFTFCNLATNNKFKRSDLEVIDNFHHEDLDADAGRLMHLGRSIQQMQDADLVVFDTLYEAAPGCSVELEVASRYDIPFVTYNGTTAYHWLSIISDILDEHGYNVAGYECETPNTK